MTTTKKAAIVNVSVRERERAWVNKRAKNKKKIITYKSKQ